MLDVKEKYRYILTIAVIAITPLLLMAALVLSGISFDQMIMFFGLAVDKNSIMVFAIIVLCFAMILAASLGAIFVLQIQESTILCLDKMIENHPDRKDFYIKLKKILVE